MERQRGWFAFGAMVLMFSGSLAQGAQRVTDRQSARDWVVRNAAVPSGPGENNRPEDLVGRLQLRDLAAIEARGLMSASLATSPWSDSYWPIYQGTLANRYADPDYPGSVDWTENADYLSAHMGQGSADLLSPAEKYDLLMGDSGFTMTRRMLEDSQRIFDRTGKIETWMGICHGWAPASYMLPRPTHAVRAMAADGKTEITFYPADIKALASLLWANARVPTRFIGGRCDEKSPGERPDARECLDTNPATWHLAVVHQIGLLQRSFVMDATYDYEVWNQPVEAYRYGYFNPLTNERVSHLADARVRLSDFRDDPYAAFRAPDAVEVVGVAMSVTYVSEYSPAAETEDRGERDEKAVVRYQYDLELDSAGRIVGGEWHTGVHPDFLWTPDPGSRAQSVSDLALDRSGDRSVWSAGTAVPAAWRAQVRRASSAGQPMARVVESLIRFANGG